MEMMIRINRKFSYTKVYDNDPMAIFEAIEYGILDNDMKIRKITKLNENCQRIDVIRLFKFPRDLNIHYSNSVGEKIEITITYENHKAVVFIKAKPILPTNIFADLQTPVRKLFSALELR